MRRCSNPPDRGIRGNSHMIMQDKNHLQIADLILQWIDEQGQDLAAGEEVAADAAGALTRRNGVLRGMFTAPVTVIAVLAAASAHAQTLVISRSGSRPVRPAPAQNFTGSVQVEMLFEAVDPSHASGGSVTFEPGARTAWHSHPRGQILIITAGTGRVQRWGDPIEEVRAGDVVRIPAGQKHWHGASPHASMTHLAISEHRDGSAVQWMEQVSDEQYNGAPSASATRIDTAAAEPVALSLSHRTRSRAPAGPRVRFNRSSRPAWRRSPMTCSTATSGGGPICRRAIAAWSRLRP